VQISKDRRGLEVKYRVERIYKQEKVRDELRMD